MKPALGGLMVVTWFLSVTVFVFGLFMLLNYLVGSAAALGGTIVISFAVTVLLMGMP